jgi:hypothetical protein
MLRKSPAATGLRASSKILAMLVTDAGHPHLFRQANGGPGVNLLPASILTKPLMLMTSLSIAPAGVGYPRNPCT